jgi:sterol 3beta-glucosyltransferase
MKIGIYTYGTRGDVQPYIALALGLMDKGHEVSLAAPENFKSFVESFGVSFHPLYGDAEALMNTPEVKKILQSDNMIELMQYMFRAINKMKVPLRKSYYESISKIDFIVANTITLPIVSAIGEQQNKRIAWSFFMPPVVPTKEFPMADFDFLNFPTYNKLTYKIAQSFYWQFVKEETNEYRQELGLPILKENLISHIGKHKPLDLYCFSPNLIPQPHDWAENHKITGFINISGHKREEEDSDQTALNDWLKNGEKPIYVGFGSNGIGNPEKMTHILTEVLNKTKERILFCTGWSVFDNLPKHDKLFVTKYVNHETILPHCKVGVFHGGAGTLATMLRHNLPVVVVSFYTDQPTWGKIVKAKKLGVHIPVRKLTADKLITALQLAQTDAIKNNVLDMGQKIRNENGLENAIYQLENYFEGLSGDKQ